MSAPRSPKYPSIPLAQAVELARELWEREKKTPVGADLVGKAWGYKGDSGPVRAKIGSLRQYGLLDGTRDGVKVSDLAVEIIVHEPGSPEKLHALATAALNPPLFSEIYATHRDSSADSLRAYLITKKGFNPDAATQFVSSFKATIDLVGHFTATYDASAKGGQEPTEAAPAQSAAATAAAPGARSAQRSQLEVGMQEATFPLAEGAAVLQWPTTLSPESYEDFEAWVQLTLRRAKRSIVQQSGAQPETGDGKP